jgi:hypothetical protein
MVVGRRAGSQVRMPHRLLQNRYCVAALQHRLWYNLIMSLTADQRDNQPAAPTLRAAGPRRGRVRYGGLGLGAVALIGASFLVAGCGGGPSGHAVAHLGKVTTTGSSAPQSGNTANPSSHALAFVKCMRAHGDATIPDPDISGHRVNINVDPNAPHFAAAYDACRHLLPNNGVPRNRVTPADQADYIRAAACMRSHGVPNFPDPVFKDGSVDFQSRSPIDTSSPQYKSALVTCQKLIPKGLPYSGTGGA